VDPDKKKVICAGYKPLVDRVSGELKLFFDENIIYSKLYTQNVDFPPDDLAFLRLVKHRDLAAFDVCLSQSAVQITGNNFHQAKFYSLLKNLLKTKVECQFRLKQPLFMSVFTDPKAHLQLRHLQEREGCVIKLVSDEFLLVSDTLLKIDNVKFGLEEIVASQVGTEELEHALLGEVDRETRERIEVVCGEEELLVRWTVALSRISLTGRCASIVRGVKRITGILIGLAAYR
jgi:hypothetical protein